MSTLRQVMRDISILRAAAVLLKEPIYIFGDDAKDYFNQLAIAPEDWWKLGVVFIHSSDDLERVSAGSTARARIFFVSERRLGFGARMSSNVAQRFSEAILNMLREDMDAAEATQEPDARPSAHRWRRARAPLCRDEHAPELESPCEPDPAQLRLWVAHMYTDDPIFVVVGVERALLLLRCWHLLTRRLQLIMAIPEKRNLGTWAPWLGVLVCVGLGIVIVPKAKLLRTTQRIQKINQCNMHDVCRKL